MKSRSVVRHVASRRGMRPCRRWSGSSTSRASTRCSPRSARAASPSSGRRCALERSLRRARGRGRPAGRLGRRPGRRQLSAAPRRRRRAVRPGGRTRLAQAVPYLVGPLARWSLNRDRLPAEVLTVADAAGLEPECRNPFRCIVVRGRGDAVRPRGGAAADRRLYAARPAGGRRAAARGCRMRLVGGAAGAALAPLSFQ
jgi:hypothetical protein